jgi:hypothetical protein
MSTEKWLKISGCQLRKPNRPTEFFILLSLDLTFRELPIDYQTLAFMDGCKFSTVL